MNLVDLFAGAGGWSHGWKLATGSEPIVAVNHCDHAIHLHRLNHPGTEHWPSDVWKTDPLQAVRGRQVDWLHGSPDCTHFSRAKGGKPRKQRIRALAWVLARWARACMPTVLSLENVEEFQDWGPLHGTHSEGCTGHHRRPAHKPNGERIDWIDGETHGCKSGCWFNTPIKARAGETFRRFVGQLRRLGYVVEWRVLCAADYGAPTIRKRLFLIGRRDGKPIVWPEPTHVDPKKRDLFGAHLQPWRSAADCIDWSIPCKSIFDRKRPLAPATCRRIAAGIVRYVLKGKPFLVCLTHGGPTITADGNHTTLAAASLVALRGTADAHLHGDATDAPLRTVSAGGQHHALVAAFLQQNFTGMVGKPLTAATPTITARDHHSLVAASLIQTGYGERKGQDPRALDIEKPLGTVVAGGAKHGAVAAYLTQFREGDRNRSLDAPVPTITSGEGSVRPAGAAHATGVVAATLATDGGDRARQVAAFVVQYYGSGGQHSRADAPLPAVVTRARHGLVTVTIDGADYVLADIGLRMLEPRELARAQGFPDSYVLEGSKADQIARIGNSVCPHVAAAIVAANIGREAAVA